MESYVYLIKNKDLHVIGITKNLENVQKKLHPGKLVAFLKTKDSENLCKKIHSRYSSSRIPQSDYFRLSSFQIAECKKIMKTKNGRDFFEPIFTGNMLVITFILAWLAITSIVIKFGIDPILNRFI